MRFLWTVAVLVSGTASALTYWAMTIASPSAVSAV